MRWSGIRRMGGVLAVAAALCAGCAGVGGPGDPAVADRLALVELSHRYAWGVDTLDRATLATVFLPDARAHYLEVGTPYMGLDVRLDGLDEIWGWLHENLKGREGPAGLPMHFMSNHRVKLDGDRAKLVWYMHNRAMSAGGVYTVDAVRTDEGWRVASFLLEEQIWKPEAYGFEAPADAESKGPGIGNPETWRQGAR